MHTEKQPEQATDIVERLERATGDLFQDAADEIKRLRFGGGAMQDDKPATQTTPRGLKYTATRLDIVNDFYDEIQKLFEKYRYQREAICALDEIESLAVWWLNAPAVERPKDG